MSFQTFFSLQSQSGQMLFCTALTFIVCAKTVKTYFVGELSIYVLKLHHFIKSFDLQKSWLTKYYFISFLIA